MKAAQDADESREVLHARHQQTKNGRKTKHRFQIFDAAEKVVAQGVMSKHDTRDAAMAEASRLSAANIVVEE